MFRDYSTVERLPYVKQNEGKKELYHCEICDNDTMGWESESEVQLHKLTHTADLGTSNNPVCWLCITEFKDTVTATHHLYTDHLFTSKDALRIERDIFICDLCNSIFFNKNILISHLQMRHKQKFKTDFISCPVCEKPLKLSASFAHFNILHSLSGYTSCPICLVKCPNRKHLLEHVKNHPKHLLCHICQKCSENSTAFKEHILKEHSNNAKESQEEEEVDQSVFKYFIHPAKKANVIGKARLSLTRGLNLPEPFNLCILCRQLCVSNEEMGMHVKEHAHSVEVKVKEEVKTCFECACGEIFDHNIILKQHTLKCAVVNMKADLLDLSSEQDPVIYS